MVEGDTNYETLTSERNRLRSLLDKHSDMKHSRTYKVVESQHKDIQLKISQLIKDNNARRNAK